MKKAQTIFIILGILAVLGIILFFVFKGPSIQRETTIPQGTSQGGLTVRGCVLDRIGGNCLSTISGALQLGGGPSTPDYLSTITVEGSPKCYGVTAVRIYSSLTKQGNVPSITVNDIIGTTNPVSPNFQTAINTYMTKSFSLGSTPNEQQADVDTNGMTYNTPSNWTVFRMQIDADYLSATGNPVSVSPTPEATLNVRILQDTCSDGTPWGQCSGDQPYYCQEGVVGCEGGAGTPGTLIEKASVCGCPSGYSAQGESCVLDTCTDPSSTPVGECVSPAPSGNLQANPNANLRFCSAKDQPLVEDCRGPDGVAGNGDDCGCANDYYNGASLSCGSGGVCQYTAYTGDIGVGLTG